MSERKTMTIELKPETYRRLQECADGGDIYPPMPLKKFIQNLLEGQIEDLEQSHAFDELYDATRIDGRRK